VAYWHLARILFIENIGLNLSDLDNFLNMALEPQATKREKMKVCEKENFCASTLLQK
jgi:hypothetical protein